MGIIVPIPRLPCLHLFLLALLSVSIYPLYLSIHLLLFAPVRLNLLFTFLPLYFSFFTMGILVLAGVLEHTAL